MQRDFNIFKKRAFLFAYFKKYFPVSTKERNNECFLHWLITSKNIPVHHVSCIIISGIIKYHGLIKRHFFVSTFYHTFFSTHFSYWNLFSINLHSSSGSGIIFHLPLYYILMTRIFYTNPALNCHTEYVNDFGIHQIPNQLLMVTSKKLHQQPFIFVWVSGLHMSFFGFAYGFTQSMGQGTFRGKKSFKTKVFLVFIL